MRPLFRMQNKLHFDLQYYRWYFGNFFYEIAYICTCVCGAKVNNSECNKNSERPKWYNFNQITNYKWSICENLTFQVSWRRIRERPWAACWCRRVWPPGVPALRSAAGPRLAGGGRSRTPLPVGSRHHGLKRRKRKQWVTIINSLNPWWL